MISGGESLIVDCSPTSAISGHFYRQARLLHRVVGLCVEVTTSGLRVHKQRASKFERHGHTSSCPICVVMSPSRRWCVWRIGAWLPCQPFTSICKVTSL